MDQTAAQEKRKRRMPLGAAIAICLALLVLLAAGGYYFGYTKAKAMADEGNFASARQWLILPGLTQKHDAELLDYLDAQDLLAGENHAAAAQAFYALGEYRDSAEQALWAEYALAGEHMDAEDYTAAIEVYTRLGDYRKSAEKLLDARFGLGMQTLEGGDPAAAEDIFAQLEQAGYEGAAEARQEAIYLRAKQLMEQGELIQAHEKLGEIPGYPGMDKTMEELTELIYLAAQEAYRQDQPVDAVKYFLLITPYKNSEAYFALIQEGSGVGYSAMKISPRGLMNYDELFESMWENFELENTKEIILNDNGLACRFLKGEWKTEDGYYYFRVKLKDDGHFNASYNLPWFKEEVLSFSISDGMYILNLNNDVRKAQFQFTVIDKNTIEVYCYQNGETYMLYRQEQ